LDVRHHRDTASHCGLHSVASFPFQHSGRPFGSLNLYATETDFFDEASIDVLEEMTRDISFAIDNYARETQRKRVEALQLGQNRILGMVATGVPLQEILMQIARFGETHSSRGLCSVSLLNAEDSVLSDAVAPSLPAYTSQRGVLAVGPCNDSCGTAVHRAEPVLVTEIASDPLWESGRDLAFQHGLKACASWPIFGKSRKILGTFALYFRDTVAPASQDLQLADICTCLAGIAIESRASEERIRYLAHYDGLTSLPNRFLFNEYLDLALRSARRHNQKFAVFFVDLDKFKDINDTLGHEAGDQVLREIAARLRSVLRHTDKIARMGGDEFYVLIEDLTDGRYAADVARKLLDEASRPIRINGQECQLSASVGIAIYPGDGDDAQTLLKNADGAMYRAKELGKNGYQFFAAYANAETKKALYRLSDDLISM
jgi:diguanylate cyclase (GGDEF)-like protein